MPRALCLTSLVVSILVVVLFVEDAVASLLGMTGLAIFGGANLVMDLVFAAVAGALIYMSWTTYREQR
jgi:zinc transporter ZupT